MDANVVELQAMIERQVQFVRRDTGLRCRNKFPMFHAIRTLRILVTTLGWAMTAHVGERERARRKSASETLADDLENTVQTCGP